jgi:hypothetical protein
MRLLDFFFAVILTVSAALQLNDPDPIYWVAVYGAGAAVAFIHGIGRRAAFLAALTIGLILSGMIYSAPGFLEFIQIGDLLSISDAITGPMDGPNPYVEPAREFLGLVIALAIVASYSLRWRQPERFRN